MKKTLCTTFGSVCIEWDDEELNGIIHPLFSPWDCDDNNPLFTVSIKHHDDKYYLISHNGEFCLDTIGEMFANLEYALTEIFQDIFKTNLLIHASSIEKNGKAVLFIGNHGTGKTTLALTGISSNLRALTDDVAIVTKGTNEIIGFPRPFKVSADIWTMLPHVVPQESPFFQCSDDLYYLHFYQPSNGYSDSAKIKHIIFPSREEGQTSIRELGETEAIRRLLTQGFNFYLRKDTIISEIIELLRTAPPIEIRYSNHWDAIAKVSELL